MQFLDEVGRGRLRGHDSYKDLFSRVSRTLKEGLQVGRRQYTFLAFGNSQLREHGAYFFADCAGASDCNNSTCKRLTVSDIRRNIGDVSKIKIVAKQAARVGQAFSTTRAVSSGLQNLRLVLIPDLIGGLDTRFCFSDGVGLISGDVLEEVSEEMLSHGHVPSAVQFRLGGSKGVLTKMKPDASGNTTRQICLRPSQVKFESGHGSLEIGMTPGAS